jgi:uncharacterized protein YdiU (UPF0061 family)
VFLLRRQLYAFFLFCFVFFLLYCSSGVNEHALLVCRVRSSWNTIFFRFKSRKLPTFYRPDVAHRVMLLGARVRGLPGVINNNTNIRRTISPSVFSKPCTSYTSRILLKCGKRSRSSGSCASSSSGRSRGSAMQNMEMQTSVQAQSENGHDNGSLKTLETLKFSNTFTESLPGDTDRTNNVRQVHGAFYSYVSPTPTDTEPHVVSYAPAVARLIGLEPSECQRPEFALIFSGNGNPKNWSPRNFPPPYAQCYGGHQFGSWAGQLGDGRAISLGELLNESTGVRWELQLKGAGKTPYSRFADGRAVLRSSLREYVGSEAMAALGVPTTRALSLVSTGQGVVRDMFYSGNPQEEPGAVVCRVARSFIRFGTFQLPVSRGDEGVMIRTLADYVIKHFYEEECVKSAEEEEEEDGNKYLKLLKTVASRTGRLIAEWHRVGFVHGVLNTDNMSILGDTIDYGPFAWLERFDPDFTPNTTDLPGRRYAFGAQPEIGQWNVLQLARAFVTGGLINEEQGADGIRAYGTALTSHYNEIMARKMGFIDFQKNLQLTNDFLRAMYDDGSDYTNTFRALSSVSIDDPSIIPAPLAAAVEWDGLSDERKTAWADWVARYKDALRNNGVEEREKVQNAANPAIIPRNHVLVDIIGEAEDGNYDLLEEYLDVLQTPYCTETVTKAQASHPSWFVPAPKKSRLGVELLSCSS